MAKSDSEEPSRVYNAFMIAAPFASLLAFIATCFINFLGAQDADKLKWGVFKNSTSDISDKYYLEVTPAGWTFSIWGFIYTYQVIFLVYWLTLLCRKNRVTMEPLYRSPVFMSPWIGFFYVINMICNLSWMIVWDRQNLPVAFALLALTSLTLYICIGISFYCLSSNKQRMMDENLGLDIKLVIGIVHNGLGMYATWCTIAALFNLAHVLTYEEGIGLQQSIASTISLSVLMLELVVYVFVDNILLEKHTRYLFTPYIVLIVGLTGSIDKNWDSEKSNSVFTAGLLVACIFAAVMKILLVVYRTRRKPLYQSV